MSDNIKIYMRIVAVVVLILIEIMAFLATLPTLLFFFLFPFSVFFLAMNAIAISAIISKKAMSNTIYGLYVLSIVMEALVCWYGVNLLAVRCIDACSQSPQSPHFTMGGSIVVIIFTVILLLISFIWQKKAKNFLV
ncbi:MAG: hypothetical protein ACYDBX_02315 [Patescibacteria group bacterium]